MRATPAARPADSSSEFAQMKARAEMMTSGSTPKPAELAASPGELSPERAARFEREPTPGAQEAETEPPVDETFWEGLQRSISSLLQGSAKKPKLAHARTAPRLDDTSAGGRLATRDAKLADLAAREAELRVHVSTAIKAIRGMEGEMREHERRVAGSEEQLGPLTKENATIRMAVMQSRQAQADATSALAKAREEADAIELQIEKLRDPTGTALRDFFAEESGIEGVTTPASGATLVRDVRPRRAHASTPRPQWRAHSTEPYSVASLARARTRPSLFAGLEERDRRGRPHVGPLEQHERLGRLQREPEIIRIRELGRRAPRDQPRRLCKPGEDHTPRCAEP